MVENAWCEALNENPKSAHDVEGEEVIGGKMGRKAVKVPHIHFNMKAIEEVKERKKGLRERWSKKRRRKSGVK